VRLPRSELEFYRGATLPDLLGPALRLLFVGIDPGLLTVAVQSHFGRRGNRFYPALCRAGIVDHVIDAADGFKSDDVALLHARGIGITNIVREATARADELDAAELVAGGEVMPSAPSSCRGRGYRGLNGITSTGFYT